MGSIESYETAGGRRYRVRYRDPDRRSREKGGFKTKREAESYLAELRVAANRGQYVDPTSAKLSIRAAGSEWIANQTHLKPSSLRVLQGAWRTYVEPFWGDRRIGEIRHSEVQTWVTRFPTSDGKTRSASTVIRAYGVLAAILDIAVLDHRIAANPARGVKLPRKGKKKRAYLSPAQVELLAKHSGEHAAAVYTLAYTGMRWGELAGLRISSLDTLRRRMLIEENAVIMGGTAYVGTPKTHERRSISYPKFLAEPLARQCEGKTRDQLVFGDGTTHYQRPGSGGKGWLERAVITSQAQDPDFPRVTAHDLRHTAASIAISAGANPKAVQRMLGHASAAMTLDTYADLFEDDLDAVSERMDAVRAETVVGDLWGTGS